MDISYDEAITTLEQLWCDDCRYDLPPAECYSEHCHRGESVRMAIAALKEKSDTGAKNEIN